MALNNPISQQVLRNVVAPKFSGKSQDWTQFAQNWEQYLRKISMGQQVSDSLKLELLETVLDEINQKQLKLKQMELNG